ncbi:hypothetical protein TruAng_012183 [Truncatella angustata]|nr:hypothetical protein TruAng_012183 [Truncatella angustata]
MPQTEAYAWASGQLGWKLEEGTPKHEKFYQEVEKFLAVKDSVNPPWWAETGMLTAEASVMQIVKEGEKEFADQACKDQWVKTVQRKCHGFELDESKEWFKVTTTQQFTLVEQPSNI